MHCKDFVEKFKNSRTYLKENMKNKLKKISQKICVHLYFKNKLIYIF